jgi:hypothetical protein
MEWMYIIRILLPALSNKLERVVKGTQILTSCATKVEPLSESHYTLFFVALPDFEMSHVNKMIIYLDVNVASRTNGCFGDVSLQ